MEHVWLLMVDIHVIHCRRDFSMSITKKKVFPQINKDMKIYDLSKNLLVKEHDGDNIC